MTRVDTMSPWFIGRKEVALPVGSPMGSNIRLKVEWFRMLRLMFRAQILDAVLLFRMKVDVCFDSTSEFRR